MSKVGKVPITIPDGVEISMEGRMVEIKGPKGTLSVKVHRVIDVDISDDKVTLTLNDEQHYNGMAYWGLARALINNAITGVTEGFTKELELVGVGYRVEEISGGIRIMIGYSHPVDVMAPEGVTFELPSNTVIKITGYDKQVVGQVASDIRDVRRPEPYKGKGIKYKDEIVRRKQGKSAG